MIVFFSSFVFYVDTYIGLALPVFAFLEELVNHIVLCSRGLLQSVQAFLELAYYVGVVGFYITDWLVHVNVLFNVAI